MTTMIHRFHCILLTLTISWYYFKVIDCFMTRGSELVKKWSPTICHSLVYSIIVAGTTTRYQFFHATRTNWREINTKEDLNVNLLIPKCFVQFHV